MQENGMSTAGWVIISIADTLDGRPKDARSALAVRPRLQEGQAVEEMLPRELGQQSAIP